MIFNISDADGRKVSTTISALPFRISRRLKYEISRRIDFVERSQHNVLPGARPGSAANHQISSAILSGSPYLLSRFGRVELDLCTEEIAARALEGHVHIKNLLERLGSLDRVTDTDRRLGWEMAGIFPDTTDTAEGFALRYLDAARSVDTLVVWNLPYEALAMELTCPSAITYHPTAIDPFEFSKPWTHSLAGKRVVVVSPFVNEIVSQYQRRELLWPGIDLLPEFELVPIEAVQSIGHATGGFTDWFQALGSMTDALSAAAPFDVAIIGAGGYGLPLGAYAKRLGAVALHVGGVHQIYFGIRGERWDMHGVTAPFVNEHWIRPDPARRPAGLDGSVDGKYW